MSASGFLCKVCSIFYQKGPWLNQGVDFGDHPTRCINKHQTSLNHKQAVTTSETVSKKSLPETIVAGSKTVAQKSKENNRKLLTKYIKILYFMIKKQWAVSENFTSLVKFIGEDLGDKEIETYLNTCSKNATYLSNVYVDNIMEAISLYLEERTLTALKLTAYYTLLADESTDEAQREQLGLVVKYKIQGSPEFKEEYLGLVNLTSTNAECITSAIEKFMMAKDIKITNCLFLALDGANVMSGEISGVQRRVRHLSPHSLYINCRNHRLALVFAHLVKKYGILQAVDSLLVSLWKLFHYSPQKQQVLKDIQGDVYCLSVLKTLKVSVTRWLSHGLACERVSKRFQQLVETLDAIFVKTKEPELKGLREQLLNTDVLLCILFLADFLKVINKLSLWLQSSTIMFSCVNEKVARACAKVETCANNLYAGDNFQKCEELLQFSAERTKLGMKIRSSKNEKVTPALTVKSLKKKKK